MKLEDFSSNNENRLLINPRAGEAEFVELTELKKVFEEKYGHQGYFLIPSSGSSRGKESGMKLIALKAEHMLNSARRVNDYLQATQNDAWVLALPEFHVAGLGVRARASLAGAQVHVIPWQAKDFAEKLSVSGAAFLSLVPTQVFDLVQRQDRAPSSLKKVFVGGGALNRDLKKKFLELGWPAVETYGMTETASMVAVRDERDELFRVLSGVDVQSREGILFIKCNSMMTASVRRVSGQLEMLEPPEGSWLMTSDRGEVSFEGNIAFLKLLGRSSEYLKISGEGVSLAELRDLLTDLVTSLKLSRDQFEIVPIVDDRTGYRLSLVVEKGAQDHREELVATFNKSCRPYERIHEILIVEQIPRTEMGKLKADELGRTIEELRGDKA